jgi:hypothetical protein
MASTPASKSADDGLRAALEAGNIPVTDEALDELRTALASIGRGYRVEKVRTSAAPDAELRDTLLKLYDSLHRTADILSADLEGVAQVDAVLSAGPWHHGRLQRHLDATQALLADLDPVCRALEHELDARPRKGRHQQTIETWLMLQVHDAYGRLTGRDHPAIAARLYRFTQRCAALFDPELTIPRTVAGFRVRLKAALQRRKDQP